jgi:hypothetical protein
MLAPPPKILSPHSNPEQVLGITEPRIFTPSLVELTPETSYGFDVIAFARDVLREPLDPWQEWAVIHAGELLPDGRPRFRTVLILVARQNGKTHLLRVLKLFWLFVERWPVVLGMSTDRAYAKKAWRKVCDIALNTPLLRAQLPPPKSSRAEPGVTTLISEEALTTKAGCQYIFSATNRRAGRSLSIDRVDMDELREHHDFDAWDAATNAMNARPYAQCYCVTNQGDDTGVVLDAVHSGALKAIEKGNRRSRTGLFEWSAPKGCDLLDPHAVAAANPNLGRRIFFDDIRDSLERAANAGPDEETRARTEILCQRVNLLDAAVDGEAWADCYVGGDLAQLKSRVAACVDISPDRQHATLAVAAVMPDGRTRVELVKDWTGVTATKQLREELPALVTKIRPQALGWFPNGPAAAFTADLAGRKGWPPSGVTIEAITAEASAVCMELADLVSGRQVVHANDPLLTAHVTGAAKLMSGDKWRFSRTGGGHCDAAYAGAGAIHLARTLPPPVGKPRIVIAS